MPPSRSKVVDLILSRSTAVGAELLEPLVNFLTVARQLVQNDTDKALLLLVIIVRAGLHPEFRKLSPPDIAAGRIDQLPTLGINLRSLAESTGIPKETVRRKVQDLIDAGWVARNGGNLHYTVEAFRAVGPGRDAFARMAARIYETVERVIEEAGPQAD
jgi:hypothetical protein